MINKEDPFPDLSLYGDVVKLLLCKSCTDIFRLRYKVVKTCSCGKSKGMYTSWVDAIYSGDCVPIGFRNESFVKAVRLSGAGFTAFVASKDAESFVRVEDVEAEKEKV